MIYFLVGPPASGKGTQAQRLAAKIGAAYVSTGELLRTRASADKVLAHYLDTGHLAPESYVETLLKELAKQYRDNIIIDGAPRSPAQVAVIKKAWPQKQLAVVWIHVKEETIHARAKHRKDVEASNRRDDTDTVVTNRIRTYQTHVQSVLDAIKKSDIRLIEIDGEGSRDEIATTLHKSLGL